MGDTGGKSSMRCATKTENFWRLHIHRGRHNKTALAKLPYVERAYRQLYH